MPCHAVLHLPEELGEWLHVLHSTSLFSSSSERGVVVVAAFVVVRGIIVCRSTEYSAVVPAKLNEDRDR